MKKTQSQGYKSILKQDVIKNYRNLGFNQKLCDWAIWQIENGYFGKYVKLNTLAKLNYDLPCITIFENNPYGLNEKWKDDSHSVRFRNEYIYYYSLFYLVEESEEKKFRAYVDTDEMIDHFYKHFNLTPQDYSLPTLWVKSKDNHTKYVIVRVTEDEVTICLESYVYTIGLNQLFSRYTWLDDSPCGINEQKMKFDV